MIKSGAVSLKVKRPKEISPIEDSVHNIHHGVSKLRTEIETADDIGGVCHEITVYDGSKIVLSLRLDVPKPK